MKYSLALLSFLSLFLISCSSSDSEEPIIEIAGIFIEDDDTDYKNKLYNMPLLNVGDKVDIDLILDGNGDDLKTFMVQNEPENNLKTTMWFQGDEISNEFSDFPQGVLGFIDGISTTEITVKAEVRSIVAEEIALNFYLFSKTPNGKGASISLILKTGVPESVE